MGLIFLRGENVWFRTDECFFKKNLGYAGSLCLFAWQAILLNMKKKHYSFLDQRKTDFEVDYEEFRKSTAELHVSEIFHTPMLKKFFRQAVSENVWLISLYCRYDPVWAIFRGFICIYVPLCSLFCKYCCQCPSSTS